MMTSPATSQRHERTCVGCARKGAPAAMVRLVLGPAEGAPIAVDAAGGAFGRGAHVHPARECVERACRGGVAKAFKREVRLDPAGLRAQIREAYARRAVGMLLGARRAGHLAVGADAALDVKDAPLFVLAADAGSIAGKLERAIASGRAIVFGKKAELGELFGAGETALLAVRHDGVARALKDVIEVVQAMEER